MTEIRRATAQDAPACAKIVTGWIAATPWLTSAPDATALETALREGLPKREAYVIGDPVCGYLSLEAETAHIWGLYAATPGAGAGRALIRHVKQGRDYLQLNSHAPNIRAHGFYKSEGFVPVGAPWPGEGGVDEIRMEWHR